MAYDAVFFVSFGGPEKPDDILPFLEIVTRGRGIPLERLKEVAVHYEHIGGRSPINEITRTQAAGLRMALKRLGSSRPVYVGQRNWHPFIEDTLRQMKADGIKKAIAFITAPHRTEASLERYVNAIREAQAKIGVDVPQIDYVGPWFDHYLFIEAIADRIRETIKSIPAERLRVMPWIFTAHSVPCAMAKESTYVIELQRTAELVCRHLDKAGGGQLAYTSRSGDPRTPWLEPDISKALRAHAERGAKDVLVCPIGFVADHVEVLFDLDVEANATAKELGLTLHRVKTVGTHPLFIQMIAQLVNRDTPGEPAFCSSSQTTRFADGEIAENVGRASPVCYCEPGSASPSCLQKKK